LVVAVLLRVKIQRVMMVLPLCLQALLQQVVVVVVLLELRQDEVVALVVVAGTPLELVQRGRAIMVV
jgi:hypothetical protein